jgi:hypothetical protein
VKNFEKKITGPQSVKGGREGDKHSMWHIQEEQKCIQCCSWETLKEHLQDQGIDLKLKLKLILQEEYGRHHDKDQMWVLVNRVKNLSKCEGFLDCLSNH